MSIGQRIKERRERLGLNQKQLADASAITQATISRLESGQVLELKSEALKRLAQALGVTVDYLIGQTPKMTTQDTVSADPKAKALFRGYEKLSEEARDQLIDFVEFLKKQEKGKK